MWQTPAEWRSMFPIAPQTMSEPMKKNQTMTEKKN